MGNPTTTVNYTSNTTGSDGTISVYDQLSSPEYKNAWNLVIAHGSEAQKAYLNSLPVDGAEKFLDIFNTLARILATSDFKVTGEGDKAENNDFIKFASKFSSTQLKAILGADKNAVDFVNSLNSAAFEKLSSFGGEALKILLTGANLSKLNTDDGKSILEDNKGASALKFFCGQGNSASLISSFLGLDPEVRKFMLNNINQDRYLAFLELSIADKNLLENNKCDANACRAYLDNCGSLSKFLDSEILLLIQNFSSESLTQGLKNVTKDDTLFDILKNQDIKNLSNDQKTLFLLLSGENRTTFLELSSAQQSILSELFDNSEIGDRAKQVGALLSDEIRSAVFFSLSDTTQRKVYLALDREKAVIFSNLSETNKKTLAGFILNDGAIDRISQILKAYKDADLNAFLDNFVGRDISSLKSINEKDFSSLMEEGVDSLTSFLKLISEKERNFYLKLTSASQRALFAGLSPDLRSYFLKLPGSNINELLEHFGSNAAGLTAFLEKLTEQKVSETKLEGLSSYLMDNPSSLVTLLNLSTFEKEIYSSLGENLAKFYLELTAEQRDLLSAMSPTSRIQTVLTTNEEKFPDSLEALNKADIQELNNIKGDDFFALLLGSKTEMSQFLKCSSPEAKQAYCSLEKAEDRTKFSELERSFQNDLTLLDSDKISYVLSLPADIQALLKTCSKNDFEALNRLKINKLDNFDNFENAVASIGNLKSYLAKPITTKDLLLDELTAAQKEIFNQLDSSAQNKLIALVKDSKGQIDKNKLKALFSQYETLASLMSFLAQVSSAGLGKLHLIDAEDLKILIKKIDDLNDTMAILDLKLSKDQENLLLSLPLADAKKFLSLKPSSEDWDILKIAQKTGKASDSKDWIANLEKIINAEGSVEEKFIEKIAWLNKNGFLSGISLGDYYFSSSAVKGTKEEEKALRLQIRENYISAINLDLRTYLKAQASGNVQAISAAKTSIASKLKNLAQAVVTAKIEDTRTMVIDGVSQTVTVTKKEIIGGIPFEVIKLNDGTTRTVLATSYIQFLQDTKDPIMALTSIINCFKIYKEDAIRKILKEIQTINELVRTMNEYLAIIKEGTTWTSGKKDDAFDEGQVVGALVNERIKIPDEIFDRLEFKGPDGKVADTATVNDIKKNGLSIYHLFKCNDKSETWNKGGAGLKGYFVLESISFKVEYPSNSGIGEITLGNKSGNIVKREGYGNVLSTDRDIFFEQVKLFVENLQSAGQQLSTMMNSWNDEKNNLEQLESKILKIYENMLVETARNIR